MRISALLLLLTSATAYGGEFCQDDDLVVDTTAVWDFSSGDSHLIPLPTHYGGEEHPTQSVLSLSTGPEVLNGVFRFQSPPNQVGLAYNLYRLTVQIGADDEPDRQIIDQDYTSGCASAGVSLWPGSHLDLKPIKLEPHADGTPRGVEQVHLRFWGK